MENKCFTFLNSVAALTTLAILFAIPCRAQQAPEVSERYARAALKALHAIQAGETAESSASDIQISTELDAIDAAQAVAATDAERRFSTVLYQIYRSKVRDNDVIAAYQRVIETESFSDDSETRQIRSSKDYAASQLTDTVTEIHNREDRCFRQLETSLNQRSLRGLSGCSALIQ
jgi:hypothetical protein